MTLKCKECGKTFSDNSNLRKHARLKHPDRWETIAPPQKPKQTGTSSFKCQGCGKVFSKNKHLREHARLKHPEICENIAPLIKPKCDLQDFQCKECGKNFSSHKSLQKHMKFQHPDVFESSVLRRNTPKTNSQDAFRVCEICDKTFISRPSLLQHKRHVHKTHKSFIKGRFQCHFCEFSSNSMPVFKEHYQDRHDVRLEVEEKEFDSLSEFEAWKNETEKENNVKFVKSRGNENVNNIVKSYFYCHRSGTYVPRGKGERHLKIQGSRKMGGMCTAKITVEQIENGQVRVQYVKTHVGHQADLGHLVLDSQERGHLAGKMASKIPMDEILDEIRDSISDSNLHRLHLLTKKDLHNIEYSYKLNASAVRHKSDVVSVSAWVKELEESGDSPVLLFKPQDEFDERYPLLKKEDFFLAIMNNAQLEMLKKYGNDSVCMDSTHGMNCYDFELTTLMVLDDLREGFPAAFLFSNRTDHEVLTVFLKTICEKTGQIAPKVFMSDIAEAFYNAWVQIMKPATHRLYCTWHIDRAWRKNLSKVAKDKQVAVYKIIRTLLQESDEKAFLPMMEKALSCLLVDNDTKEFGIYFRNFYAGCAKTWAYCYRQHVGLNTNMHLERMHKTLKYIYLKGKTVKRLDKAIHAIMRFVRDKQIDRLLVLNRGKVTSKLSILRNRHKASLDLTEELVIPDSEGTRWNVASSAGSGEVHSVDKLNSACDCKLKCDTCKVCIHIYSCSCPDSSIRWNMCKHIHLVCRTVKGPLIPEQLIVDEDEEVERVLTVDINNQSNISECEAHLKQLSKRKTNGIESLRDSLKCQLDGVLTEVVNSDNVERLELISKFIKPIKPTLDAFDKNAMDIKPADSVSFNEKLKEPSNKSILKQSNMYSTKKKAKKKPRIPKPSSSECQNIALALLVSIGSETVE